jgi:microcystin-dependent protein
MSPFLGEIRMFGGTFAPAGWAFCDGRSLAIAENESLFNLIGTTYGGDGQETFNLPNLQSRIPIHQGTARSGTTYQMAEMSGVESVTLNGQQAPVHNHGFMGSTNIATQQGPGNNVLAQSTLPKMYIQDVTNASLSPNSIGQAGGSQPHENCQPFLCVNFIISLYGVFPQQT